MVDTYKDIWSKALKHFLMEKSRYEAIAKRHGQPVPPIYDNLKVSSSHFHAKYHVMDTYFLVKKSHQILEG